MRFTYDGNGPGASCLILYADDKDKKALKELGRTMRDESIALEELISNSELEWISPEEIGALTDAPILGIRGEDQEVLFAWGFMSYQVRSFIDDLIEDGKAIFTS